MTTETELRDLLESEAHGTVRASADWDDVVRRGAHHRRKARMRNGLVAGGLVAIAVVSLLSLGPQQPGRDQTTAAGPTTTTVLSQRPPPVPDLEVATAQGVSVTVVLDAATPEADFDPCTDQTVLVSESTSEVTLTIDQDGEVGGAETWAACGSGPHISWGRVDLKDPLGTRTLIDASDGVPLTVLDGSPLLFPSWVPEPFDLARWNDGETRRHQVALTSTTAGVSRSPLHPTAFCTSTTGRWAGVRVVAPPSTFAERSGDSARTPPAASRWSGPKTTHFTSSTSTPVGTTSRPPTCCGSPKDSNRWVDVAADTCARESPSELGVSGRARCLDERPILGARGSRRHSGQADVR